jgi:RNA polymerase sigma factor (sigma-70 family)
MEPDRGARRVPAVISDLQDVSTDPLRRAREAGLPADPSDANADSPVLSVRVVGGQAFVGFYRDSREPLARAVTVTLGDRDLAVEAVDEAMARAYQRWARVGQLDNPGGWVYRVALNWATSILRKRRRARTIGPPIDAVVHPPAASEPDVMRALAELDVRQRAVVVCRYLLGFSEAETAEALSTRPGTVKSRLFRANRHLSNRLSHLGKDEHRG